MNALPAGDPVHISLPVVLSKEARREAVIATGRQPDPVQILEIDDLAALDQEQRERVVDVWERLTRGGDREEDGTRLEPEVIGYEWLHWRAGRWSLYEKGGDSVELDRVFFSVPGRTLRLFECVRREVEDTKALDAMLDEAPLLRRLGEDGELVLDDVLAAYEEAFALARRIRDLARRGRIPEGEAFATSTESLIFFGRGPYLPIALLHDSDPQAFEETDKLVRAVDSTGVAFSAFAEAVCEAASRLGGEIDSDAAVVALVVRPVAEALIREAEERARTAGESEAYERGRAEWIAKHGSPRLKLAAERGYKHDGIYRDERLEIELPGFLGGIGRKADIREVVNPAAESIEAETETLQKLSGLGLEDVEVRIVWVKTNDYKLHDGEYVQIKGYLGRHTVYRLTRDEEPDIPF